MGKTSYDLLLKQVKELMEDAIPPEGNISNLLAFLKQELDLFWIGLYMKVSPDTLGLGIFQGMPACTLIKYGKGVCGTAAQKAETVLVDDVSLFPGYIACHSEARSEIVVPGFKDGKVNFVLDVDSVELAFFKEEEKAFFEEITLLLENYANR